MRISFDAAELELATVLVGGKGSALEAAARKTLVIGAAIRHGLEGALLHRLGGTAVSDQTWEIRALVAGRDVAAVETAFLGRSAAILSGNLAALGVDHRMVKGAALLPWLPAPGCRRMADFDVLLRATDRPRVVANLSTLGLTPTLRVRHDGSVSIPSRGLESIVAHDADGALVDLHFTTRALPPALPGTFLQTPESLAVALSQHVVGHHRPSARLVLRHVADLAWLLEAGHTPSILRSSVDVPELRASLRWMAFLGAPSLEGRIEPSRDPPRGRWHAARRLVARALVLASEGRLARAIFPARAYLVTHDASAYHASTAILHLRRYRRLVQKLVVAERL